MYKKEICEMDPKIRILVPDDWSSTRCGTYFENLIGKLFRQMQFKVTQQVRVVGMEIDLLAEHLHERRQAFIECKFRKDNFGSDIVTKLVGNAMSREDIHVAYLVTTANPGKDAKGLLKEYEKKGNLIRGVLRFAYVGPTELLDLYLEVNQYPNLDSRLAEIGFTEDISAATLVITPDESCWVLEQQKGGFPAKAMALPVASGIKLIDYENFIKLVEKDQAWPGLQIVNGITYSGKYTSGLKRQVITRIPVADRYDDYNPARPRDFVGRVELQRDVFRFFERVRNRETDKRVVALSGPSGFGKSSFVLKLAEKAKGNYYKNKFYLFDIDSRSASGSLFVPKAIKAAFEKAIEDGFIDYPDSELAIDSVEDPFSSSSLKDCLVGLKDSKRVLIIFFDQFEELLSKEFLFDTFVLFQRTALVVEALRSNLILGFSWRTGISFPEDHPAYYMWHSLQEKRAEFKIGLFTNTESSKMLTVLENNLGQKLEVTLRRNLSEQGQSFPWLLKKLCVHVYRQVSAGTSQRELVERQLNVASLFEDDTQNLTDKQLTCLKYIAENSPVDLVQVHEEFGPELPDFLYHHRLIIRSGYRYSVYWDIFREYLISGKVPRIPMTYFPQAQLSTSLSVLSYIAKEKSVTVDEICDHFKYNEGTVFNIVGDLSTLFLVKRDRDGNLRAVDELIDHLQKNSSIESFVSEYVADQWDRHIVLQIFRQAVGPRDLTSQAELERGVAELYSSISATSLHTYMNRLLSWLEFSGWVELESSGQVIRPSSVGKNKGKAVRRNSRLVDGKAAFLCSASPARVVNLAVRLCLRSQLSRTEILEGSDRNAAQDLTSLELAEWKNRRLHPTGELAQVAQNYDSVQDVKHECFRSVKQSAMNSKFLKLVTKNLGDSTADKDEEIIQDVAEQLGRDWHPASARRYLRGGRSWLEFFGELQKLRGQMSLFEKDPVFELKWEEPTESS
jgi:hypothetical protein